MKSRHRFLLAALALIATPAFATPVAQTMGSNLTAYNGASGAMTNNTWNSMINARSGGNAASAPTADFGNCNALIMRCAQPKCASGGCTDLNVAATIVQGCVNSNETCKKHGDELVQYISAQLVASSTAKVQQQQLAAQQSAAATAAQQNAAQMQQMQMQMQQMQSDMAAQNAATVAQLQAALEEQKQLTAEAVAQASAPQAAAAQSVGGNLSNTQVAAASAGVSADVLVREQISGQIMSAVENAETALKTLQATMKDAFDYAGCDNSGNNCTGPTRVKVFKQRAMNFFEPYNAVLDELYDALIMAQSLGVDITDIYMMLNGTCNAWAQYLCMKDQTMHYDNNNCQGGKSVPVKGTSIIGNAKCTVGQVVPMSDGGCQLIKMLNNQEDIQRNWLDPQEGDNTLVRVGCASEALDNSALFRNRKKQATIDIETLERIIEQDAPASVGSSLFASSTTPADGAKYCAVTNETYQTLQQAVAMKRLPDKVCVNNNTLKNTPINVSIETVLEVMSPETDDYINQRECSYYTNIGAVWDTKTKTCDCSKIRDDMDRMYCESSQV